MLEKKMKNCIFSLSFFTMPLFHKPTIDNLLGHCDVKNPSEIPSITNVSLTWVNLIGGLKCLDFLAFSIEGRSFYHQSCFHLFLQY